MSTWLLDNYYYGAWHSLKDMNINSKTSRSLVHWIGKQIPQSNSTSTRQYHAHDHDGSGGNICLLSPCTLNGVVSHTVVFQERVHMHISLKLVTTRMARWHAGAGNLVPGWDVSSASSQPEWFRLRKLIQVAGICERPIRNTAASGTKDGNANANGCMKGSINNEVR